MIYNVEVNDRIISLISIENEDGETVDSVGGNKGDKVRFTIYGDLNITAAPIKAAFLWNGKYHLEDVIDIDATQGLFYCYVPPIFNSNNFYLGLYIGEDADEAPYLSTNRVEIPCKLSIRDYIKVPQDSHLGKYTDIVAFNAYRAETAATNAANSEKESRESAKSADEDAVSAKADAERAEAAAERAVQAEANTPTITQTLGGSVTAVMSQKATTDAIDEVKETLVNQDKGFETLKPYSSFKQGALDSGVIVNWGKNRVSSVDIITFGRDIELNIKSGFRIAVHYFENGSFVAPDSGWVQIRYNIENGKAFKICIARVSEVSSEIADIDEFVSAVTFETITEGKLKAMSEDVDRISASAENVEYAKGEAHAVSPAYTYIPIIEGYNFEKGQAYKIECVAETNSTDYAVYPSISFADGTYYSGMNGFDHTQGKNVNIFAPDKSYENASIVFRSSLASGLIVKARVMKDIDVVAIQKASERATSNFNIFSLPLYHHMNQEDVRYCNIPAESLHDIHYAKALGFNMIEANPHKCSDGVYVCKHGSGGKIGYGLESADGTNCIETAFADVTSTWVRENVTYSSALSKYKGVIPTLDEFCAECRKLNMMIKLYDHDGVLDIARKYLPDDMIWITATNRGDFRGTIEYIWNGTKDISRLIGECKVIGAPLNIVIEAGKFDGLSDEKVIELCKKAHEYGFTVGVVYPTSTSLIRAFKLGVDVAGATSTNVNFLTCGNEKNIVDLDSSELTLSNATYDETDDTITIASGGSVVVNGNEFKGGIVSLRIRYNGTLTISNFEKKNHLDAFVSDGSNIVEFSTVIQPIGTTKHTRWLTIEANADTTIYDIEVHCSRI